MSARSILCFVLALLLAPHFTNAATLHGTVTDPDGRPVPGARIVLTTPLGIVQSGVSDPQGVYRIESLDAGR